MAALAVAAITEAGVTVTTVFLTYPGDYYGAPIPVGTGCFDLPLGRPDCATTFSGLLFTADVVVTWPLWLFIARWSGVAGLLGALVGSLVSIGLIPVMVAYQAPIVGLPIPLGRSTPIPNALTVWLDLVILAALASAVVRLLRARDPSRTNARRAG